MVDTKDEAFDAWLDDMAKQRRLGPGCGHAEFEGADWREQVRWRMGRGFRPMLAIAYKAWAAKRHLGAAGAS